MAATPLSYYPSEDQLAARIKSFETTPFVAEQGNLGDHAKLPRSLESPLAWSREDIENDMHKCILKLSQADVTALEQAARDFEGLYLCRFFTDFL